MTGNQTQQPSTRLKKTSQASLVLLALFVAAACTQKKQLMNKVDPDAYIAKADLVGKTFHLSRGVEEADSDNTVGATPGMSEDYGLVEARVTEKELQFVSTFDPNGRPSTNKIVASYPITAQFDIEREKNDFGEKTNKIIEFKERAWNDRAFIRVDWEHPSNTISNFAASLVGQDSGVKEENTVLLETPKVDDKGHISFLVENSIETGDSKTYTFPYGISSGGAYRIVYRTHLMPLAKTDFEAVPYSLKDFERFGFFYTQQNIEDPEKGLLDKNIHLYANVHNVCEAGRAGSCSTNKIVWVLSKNYPEFYKETTRKVVKEWNETFQQALNRKDDIVVLDETQQAEISDPSFNVIAFYPEKTKSGLLGVAQWVADPRNGQLNGVRATVYGDGINYVLGNIDTTLDLIISGDKSITDVIQTDALKGSPDKMVSPFKNPKTNKKFAELNRQLLGIDKMKTAQNFGVDMKSAIQATRDQAASQTADKSYIRMAKLASKLPETFALNELKLVGNDELKQADATFPTSVSGVKMPDLNGMEKIVFQEEKLKADKQALLHQATTGVHGTEMVEEAALRYLLKLVKEGATVEDLRANRQKIKDEIAKETLYTTLLHEMGHAFGLRHNFHGSSDREHYYPKYAELAKKLAAGDKSVIDEDLDPYASSSIMDYGRDFYAQMGGLGPYDKAAIKYAYNRSINRDNDPITKAGYAFCTDHQVDESVLCRRFDKGSTVSEITMNTVKRYETNYALQHFRRGRVSVDNGRAWGSTQGLMNSLMQYTFIPVRQVMDEFIYSIISGEQVPAAERTGTLCDYKFVRSSVDAGELADICSRTKMEQAGVNPTDLETLYAALTDDNGNPLKDPSTYMPYGAADLLYANMIARGFFQNVIGSTEPGTYLVQKDDADGQFHLKKLDDDQATDHDKLVAYATDNDIDNPEGFATGMAPFVTDVKVGAYGRPYMSTTSVIAGHTRNESIGSFWDKFAAIKALSARYIGVEKYMTDSLNANPYFYPQTKKFTTGLFSRLMTGDKNVAAIPVTIRGGGKIPAATIPAVAEASMNADSQAISTFYVFALMTSETDVTMLDKLRICNSNEKQCDSSITGEKVEFRSTSGGDVFRASQTLQNDSIAFDLVKQAKAIDDKRTAFAELIKNATTSATDRKTQIAQIAEMRTKIDAQFKALPELEELRLQFSDSSEKSVWSVFAGVAKNIDIVPLFTTIETGSKLAGVFQQVSTLIGKEITDMGNKGVCTAQSAVDNAPAAPAANCANVDQDRRTKLVALQADLDKTSDLVVSVVNSSVGSKAAPVQLQSLNTQLSTKEAQIRSFRRLMSELEGL